MKQAYEARQDGEISVKHFITLNTAADNQRERLLSAPLPAAAYRLIEEIVTASENKLGYLGWAMYGDNNPSHPIHTLNSCVGGSCGCKPKSKLFTHRVDVNWRATSAITPTSAISQS